MRYRLAIFDFDGTLADSFPWFIGVFNQVADRYRFRRIEAGEVEGLRGLGARQMVRDLGVPAWKLPLIANHMRALMTRDAGTIRPFPGAEDALARLAARGLPLALLTSNSEENVRRILGPETAALFARRECGASIFGKRARLRRLLRRSGVPAREVICVGDEIRDHEAAASEGVAFGAVTWGYTVPAALRARNPEETFESFEDMVAKLS